MLSNEELNYGAYRKVREAARDLLYAKHGDKWREHEHIPVGCEQKLLAFMLAFAEGDPTALKAVGCE